CRRRFGRDFVRSIRLNHTHNSFPDRHHNYSRCSHPIDLGVSGNCFGDCPARRNLSGLASSGAPGGRCPPYVLSYQTIINSISWGSSGKSWRKNGKSSATGRTLAAAIQVAPVSSGPTPRRVSAKVLTRSTLERATTEKQASVG